MYSLGFDAYALDVVDFPNGMELYLTQELGLHRIVRPPLLPFFSRSTGNADDDANSRYSQPIALSTAPGFPVAQANEIVGAVGGGMYVAGRNSHHITRSKYGRRLINSSMRGVKKAQNLSTPTGGCICSLYLPCDANAVLCAP